MYRSPQKYKLWCNSVQLTFPTEKKIDLPSLVEKPSKFHKALCRLSLVPIAKKTVNFHLDLALTSALFNARFILPGI